MTAAVGVDVALPRPRDVSGLFGLYVHVPFCVRRCWYCDFNAYAGLDHLAGDYMPALAADAARALSAPEALEERPGVTSIFVGGGTPTHVEAAALTGVLDAIRSAWPVARQCEVTIECNPESATAQKLEAYLRAGVTRVSFGVQSLDDALLASLGRAHDARGALDALARARATGFEDVNADLIFGIPGEDDDTLRGGIEGVLEAGVTHVSCYALTYEEGTPLEAWRRLGKIEPVDDDLVADRWELADDLLTCAGLERYEISNWARPGRQCRHNLLYWSCGEYLGIGAGAHSHLSGEADSARSWTVKPPAAYARAVRQGRRPVAGSERIDAAMRRSEAMFLGLRRARGIDAAEFAALTGHDLGSAFGHTLARQADAGLLTWDGATAALTRRGTLLANQVVSEFLVDAGREPV